MLYWNILPFTDYTSDGLPRRKIDKVLIRSSNGNYRKSLANSFVVPALLVVEILRHIFLIVSSLINIPRFSSFLKFNAFFSSISAICKISSERE